MGISKVKLSSEGVIEAEFNAARCEAKNTHLLHYIPEGETRDFLVGVQLPPSSTSFEKRLRSLFQRHSVSPAVVALYDLKAKNAASGKLPLNLDLFENGVA